MATRLTNETTVVSHGTLLKSVPRDTCCIADTEPRSYAAAGGSAEFVGPERFTAIHRRLISNSIIQGRKSRGARLIADLGKALSASLAPAILNRDIPALDPPQLTQPLHKSGGQMARICHRTRGHHPNGRQLSSLLRPGRERPSRRCAAEQRYELALVHSITSSTSASNLSGMVSPSAFAVLRLTANWKRVGLMTGRSAVFSPLRMRPAYIAARRKASVKFAS